MDLVKKIALTNAVKLLADNDIEVSNRVDKPTEAYVPTKTFLSMFPEYDVNPSETEDGKRYGLYRLTTMYEGILYTTLAYEREFKERDANEAV